jgi:nucleotide-binding universal stress UspA family protein
MSGTDLARIAVALDGSGHAEHALDLGISLARHYDASLVLISIVPFQPALPLAAGAPIVVPEDLTPVYDQLLSGAKATAEHAGAREVTTVRLEGHIADALVDYLEAHPMDLLIMGSRGLSAPGRLFLGSVSDAVVHHAPCPVLIVKQARSPSAAPPARGKIP